MDFSKSKFNTKKVTPKKDLKAITSKIYPRGKEGVKAGSKSGANKMAPAATKSPKAAKDMGDSGKFGPAMKNMPNSLYKRK